MKLDFIGIGAQKSATSWLHWVLSAHPRIVTSDPKELNYFNAHYERGEIWLASHFRGPLLGARVGECSPNYFTSRDAVRRAHDHNPALRLIAILRDPVARIQSNHLHELRKGHIPPGTPLRTAMAANPAYLEQSRYAQALDRWIDVFGREALLVLLAEDVGADPRTAYAAVCRHLVVDPTFVPEGLGERRHESVTPRLPWVQWPLRRLGDVARRAGLSRMVDGVKHAPGVRHALDLNMRDLRQTEPPMPDDLKDQLARTLREDVDFVADLLGRDSLPWQTWDILHPVRPQVPRLVHVAGR